MNLLHVYIFLGLLRLQQLYQTMQPGKTAFKITIVKRIYDATDAIDFLLALEQFDRWSNKRIVLDCNAKNAKSILVEHVRKVQLGRRTYHYMLSGLVSLILFYICFICMYVHIYMDLCMYV